MIGALISPEVKKIFSDADEERTGLFDQFDNKLNVKEAINKNYQLVEFYREHKMIKLTANALCYLIRRRNIKERTNPTPTRDISSFEECDAWDLFEERLKRYRDETNN